MVTEMNVFLVKPDGLHHQVRVPCDQEKTLFRLANGESSSFLVTTGQSQAVGYVRRTQKERAEMTDS